MTIYNDQVSRYITDLFASHDSALHRAWEETPKKGLPPISIKPEEGRFLQFLVGACRAIRVLEIGALGGYSGIWIGRGLAAGGRLITLEKEPQHAEVARQHFEAAGLSDRIEVRVGDAHELLKDLSLEPLFDFVFIDADKNGYNEYLDWALEHTRTGGVITAHNAFRKGSVIGMSEDDQYTQIMRKFNQRFAEETRLISTIFPAGDGMLVGVKVD